MQVFSTIPIKQKNTQAQSRLSIFWYILSLAFAIGYITIGIQKGFSGKYVVSDDAREYLPWIYRYFDSGLFPNDLIADYFQSVTPLGYSYLYKITTFFGIDPIIFSKVLPIILGVITTTYCFAVCMQILAIPMTGFIACLLINQSLCLHDNLFSATPRDFIYPLFFIFIYYVLRDSRLGILIAIALQALIYPLIAFVDLLILFLRLFRWQNRRITLTPNRKDFRLFVAAVIITGVIILPYAIQSGQFGPTITAAVARTMPEYWHGGRVSYFTNNTIRYWLDGRDSGFLALIRPPQLLIGLLLPIICKFPSRFPLVEQIKDNIKILPTVVIASSTMFFTAHAVAFKLHWPSRYTNHTFKMVLTLASAIALTVIMDAVIRWSKANKKQFLSWSAISIVGIAVIFYPNILLKSFPKTPYVGGNEAALYEFLQKQPQNIVVASTSKETDNIPIFTRRSVLVGKEFALPFHTKYYAQFQQRMLDLINAQYSEDINQVKEFIQKYRVTYWLLEPTAFTSKYIAENKWLQQYQPAAQQAITKVQTPILSKLIDACAVFKTDNFVLLKSDCINE
jgi:hypothetical protein